MKVFNKKWVLLIAIFLLFLAYRLLVGKLFSENTIMGIVIFAPFLYWWIVPYLVGTDMVIPTTASSLKAGELPFLRLVFFVMGIVLIILSAQM
jgi:hypothetical protein